MEKCPRREYTSGIMPSFSLVVAVGAIAFLYASVGFGGASGYLAAMSLFNFSPQVMASTALTLNLLVASIAFWAYFRAGHFLPRLLWPFLLTSIPAAFVGGYIHIPTNTYLILLYLSLSYVCARMLFYRELSEAEGEARREFPLWMGMLAGGAIGLLSGIIGIGGGIFLSPLIVVSRWGTPKQAAASAAAFIFVNSASGLIGRVAGGTLELGILGLALLPAGLIGALGGSRLGARYLSNAGLRRVLGVVLLIAVTRFWVGLLG